MDARSGAEISTAGEIESRWWRFESSRYRIVDLDVGFRLDDAALGAFFAEIFEPFQAPGQPAEWYSIVDRRETPMGGHAVYLGTEEILSNADRDLLVGILLWHLNQRVMDETRSCLAIHAAVASLNGQAVVLPGDADAGKSTLVAALVADGFDYLSDEAAMVDLASYEVRPYPRAISLQEGSWPLLPELKPRDEPGYHQDHQWIVPPARIRRDSVGLAGPVAAIVIPRLTPGTDSHLRPVSRAFVVRLMAERATNLLELGTPGFAALVALARAARCYELCLDGVERAVHTIRALITDRGQNFGFRTEGSGW